jgi:hypothetical protein
VLRWWRERDWRSFGEPISLSANGDKPLGALRAPWTC